MGADTVRLMEIAGINLDPWQRDVLRDGLLQRPDGKWSAFEVGLAVTRQNGKSEILLARILAGLFLLDERLITFSAHLFPTALEIFGRLQEVLRNTPEFDCRVAKILTANGKEGVTLTTGQRVKFQARTKAAGRGFTGDCLIYDEAMDISEQAHGSTLPSLSARPNPQVWYAGSAVDQWQHENGIVFSRLRERALAGGDDGLCWLEWSAEGDNPEAVTAEMATDPTVWAQANPALGIRIGHEHVANEQRSMGARSFAVERLGVGDWPRTDGKTEAVLDPDEWAGLLDPDSELVDPVAIAWDITPDRHMSAVAAAGKREDGLWGVEIIEYRRGTGWLPKFLAGVESRQNPAVIGTDKGSPAGALIPEVNDLMAGEVEELSGRDYANGCATFYDAVEDQVLRHRGQPELDAAVQVAVKRKLGEAWAWSRQEGDISPLVAATVALRLARTYGETSTYEQEEKELIVL